MERYREYTSSGTVQLERWTMLAGGVAQIDTLTVDGGQAIVNPTSTIRFQYRDHLGSSTVEANELGQVISYEEYYPYGSSAYRAASSSANLSLKRYRFTNKEKDDETGLYYFGVRYYVAWLGRWKSADPGGFVDGLNLYRYTRNNPVNGVDEMGYSTEPPPDTNPPFPNIIVEIVLPSLNEIEASEESSVNGTQEHNGVWIDVREAEDGSQSFYYYDITKPSNENPWVSFVPEVDCSITERISVQPNVAFFNQVGNPGHAGVVNLITGEAYEINYAIVNTDDGPSTSTGTGVWRSIKNTIMDAGGTPNVVQMEPGSEYLTWQLFEPGTATPFLGDDPNIPGINFWSTGGSGRTPKAVDGIKLQLLYAPNLDELIMEHEANVAAGNALGGFNYIIDGVCTSYACNLLDTGYGYEDIWRRITFASNGYRTFGVPHMPFTKPDEGTMYMSIEFDVEVPPPALPPPKVESIPSIRDIISEGSSRIRSIYVPNW